MGSVLIVPVRIYEESMADARRLAEWLDDQGIDVRWAPQIGRDEDADLSDVDLAVSLGGDGTLLRAAHMVMASGREIPVLGLSYGHLGFLTCDRGALDVTQMVGMALAGELLQVRRATLAGELTGRDANGAEVTRAVSGLNEIVLSRGGSGKIVECSVRVNGHSVTDLRGDGIVVASATGSTAYALSAGGPIVSPDFRGMVCVPIAPHTLTARAFLTSSSDVVEVEVTDGRSLDRCVFADGDDVGAGVVPVSVTVRRGAHDVVLLSNAPDVFYENVSRVFYGKVR